MLKKIVFLTGTRADYGKMKALMQVVENHEAFECYVFVTGMHTMAKYGDTKQEIIKDGYKNIQVFMNQIDEEPMDLIHSNTIAGFSRYIREIAPDLIVIHGDRVEAFAGAIVGALNNILVAHIEGGEVSGTIDESIRHSISKLAHLHFVSNAEAKKRLIQLGELEKSIFIIGSPDIEIIMNSKQVEYTDVLNRYNILYEKFAIGIFHPITTELEMLESHIEAYVNALIDSEDNFIMIYPNNDTGKKIIFDAYKKLEKYDRFKIFPSIRFEFFLELLKNAEYIIGNSSVGIHEAPVVGIPTINVGNRQRNRFDYQSIKHVNSDYNEIIEGIQWAKKSETFNGTDHFGKGESSKVFLQLIEGDDLWNTEKQKLFKDIKL